MSIEPRLEHRRRQVRETAARGRLKTVLWTVALVSVFGIGAWIVQSPWLAVQQIGLYGVEHSDAAAIVEKAGVRVDVPMLRVRPRTVEELLEQDPWISRAKVSRTFPHTVEIQIRERTAAAGLQWGTRWLLIAADGMLLGPADRVPDDAALLLLGDVDPGAPGKIVGQGLVGGAVEFVAALPAPMRSGTVVDLRDGELWSRTAAVYVRLGSPADMAAKAAALEAVLADGVPEGSVINLIAPSRPAVEGSS
ncbi:cell division protein DivIB [bacterium BMS3Abin02]|nr:cell division protein DivIB [bacterium BMS3Abin02]GBE21317.1 cell division protein DivIB [bacterium BMS3Bbin01]HDH24759.1 FtsQ-type POTRA domain-containing protein [Actinomycetota bacterium]HDL50073.1 FtsQ-type POTRA domain-containing protein [Actinomycetota bacterium]